jgi:predicted nucleotidyltransferase
LQPASTLRLAVLFGSGARGALRPDSDVDVGIVPRDPAMPLHEELALQARVGTAVGREVHLVRLDCADVVLRWEAARGGVILLAEPATEGTRFLAHSAIDHADMAPALERAGMRSGSSVAAEPRGRNDARASEKRLPTSCRA